MKTNNQFQNHYRQPSCYQSPLKPTLLIVLCASLLAALALAPPLVRFSVKASSDDNIWEVVNQTAQSLRSYGRVPVQAQLFQLNESALNRALSQVPSENSGEIGESQAVLTLPMPDGSYERFRIQDSPVMAPEMVAMYLEIKSYRGQGIDEPSLTMRCTWSPRGLSAMATDGAETVSIHPVSPTDARHYVSYFGKDYTAAAEEARCLVDEAKIINKRTPAHSVNSAVGNFLRTYRIAIATTYEYTSAPALGNGSVSTTIASLNTWLSSLNMIYERELAIHLNLVVNNNLVVYTTPADPFTNGTPNTMVNEVRGVLRDQIGVANYDIGQVLGTGSSGSSYVGVVCETASDASGPYRGGGATLVNAGGPAGNVTDLGMLAHEVGHQFGATHTYNSTAGGCSNRVGDTAFESGSGLTIMSSAGGCGSENIVSTRENRFHAGSFEQIASYLSFVGGSCATTSSTNNNIPAVDGGTNYLIPRDTPFTLTASGSDPDASDAPNLTYVWEQTDPGGTSFANPPYTDVSDPQVTTRPIFRPFSPSSNPSRTFPSLAYILNNANVPPAMSGGFQTAESLPKISRSLNFRVTIRDNRSGGGGVNNDSVRVDVDGGAGPFQVTAPNTAVSWTGGGSQTVTWNVNNTNAAPINCSNVKISLSTDGGNTFPIVLAANTANDGSEPVTVPTGFNLSTARIKVEAVGNIFFDVSDVNFSLTPGSGCSYAISPTTQSFSSSSGTGTESVTAGAGCSWTATSNAAWITITSGASGSGNGSVNFSIAANTGSARTGTVTIAGQTFTATQGGATIPAGLQYYPLPRPVRLFDTRNGAPACENPGVPLGTGLTRTVQARLTCDGVTIPANAQAITGNLTAVNNVGGAVNGYLTLYPSNANQPTVSNINYDAGQILANAFTVGLGGDGAFKIFSSNTTHAIIDLTGYYAPPGTGGLYYHPLPSPIRLLDTRAGETACVTPGTPLQANVPRNQQARLTCSGITIPSNAQAIVGNATVVNFISGAGYITLYPTGTTLPTASNINYLSNQVIANSFAVTLGGNGEFNINATTSTHIIIDVTGYYSSSSTADVNGAEGMLFNSLSSPIRLLDTRPGESACTAPGVPITGNTSRTQQARVTCSGVTIPSNAQVVVGNGTVVNFISGGGYITLYPTGTSQPTVSNINYLANQVIANSFVVRLSSNGEFNIYASATTHFIADISGYFAP